MTACTLRGATLVDGTGAPAFAGDVRVRDGRIVAIGELADDPSAPDVDLGGLHLAPGFIDVHTHYDAQALWDPMLTPSSWHGVTTMVLGNCGFGIAPVRPAHRASLLRVLQAVEDMPAEALGAGVDWSFETFGEYLDRLERGGPRVNMLAYVGHTPLRLYVMGDDAFERAATDAEIDEMRTILARACHDGALGLATSFAPNHVTLDGRPVPSIIGGIDEVVRLAEAMPDGCAITVARGRVPIEELRRLVRPGIRTTWSSILTGRPGEALSPQELVDHTAAIGDSTIAQFSCRPLTLRLDLRNPVSIGVLPAFREVLQGDVASRLAAYRDPVWRARAHADLDATWQAVWARAILLPAGEEDPARGRPVATTWPGVDPLDAALDQLDGPETCHRIVLTVANTDDAALTALLNDDRTLLGLSDAGAHTDQLCDAGFSSHLLGRWVRELDALSLERAVWKLTGQPAAFLGLADRGVLRPGAVADLVAFDPAIIAAEPLTRLQDQPGGVSRLVSRSRGIAEVWVGGTPLSPDGPARGVVLRRR